MLAAGLETNSCDTLAKNVVTFCFCPKNLSQTKFKSNGPISWVQVILRKPNSNSTPWSLTIALMRVYSEKKANEAERNRKCTVQREEDHQET